MTPSQLQDSPAELLLLDCRQWGGVSLGTAVLTRKPASSALGNPETILQNNDGSSHREVCALQRNGAPGSVVSLGKFLQHRFVEFRVGQQSFQPSVLLFQFFEAFGLAGFHPAIQLLPAVVGGG